MREKALAFLLACLVALASLSLQRWFTSHDESPSPGLSCCATAVDRSLTPVSPRR
jgi:hypothetical protein